MPAFKYHWVSTFSHTLNDGFMKDKTLHEDVFLYEFAIRMLAVLATILFSLLFFYGAVASAKTEFAGGRGTKAKAPSSFVQQSAVVNK